MANCRESHPDDEARVCIKGAGGHQHHSDSQGVWPNEAYVPPRPKPTKKTKNRLAEFLAVGRESGRDLAVEGADAAFTASPEEWKAAARNALRQAAKELSVVTSEDAAERVPSHIQPPEDNRAWGHVMKWGAREGLIEKMSTFTESRFAQRHVGPVQEWRSRVCVES